MKPMNGYVMLKKNPKQERKSGLVLPDGQAEEVAATGFKVLAIAEDVVDIKVGETVFPGYVDEVRAWNGFIFCRASHIVAKE